MERTQVLIAPTNSYWLLPFFLYAETHYRFRYFLSFLKKDEPEVIADLPHRVEPGHSLPVLILAKDAHTYPCVLRQITLELRQHNNVVQRFDLLKQPIVLNQKLFSHIFQIDRSELTGWLDVDVSFTLEAHGETSTYHNDNHKTSSRRPLSVFLSPHPLPRFPCLHVGDPHTHSSYTEDQVEFGSPINASRDLSRAMGLSFFCVTDHSYDLDDKLDSFLDNDPSLPKWVSFQNEVDSLNSNTEDFAIVRGEEVTCENDAGKNVHFLVFGQKEFIRGSGDGAEQWLRKKSEHTIVEVLRAKSTGATAFAAHAQEPVPFLQRLLLGRGVWSFRDLQNEGLAGLQIVNGKLDVGFEQSYHMWARLLLSGIRACAIAGNDAHGNFNRYRQIGIPFLSIREQHHQLFGKWRTGIFIEGALSEKSVLLALAQGRTIMTDGPVVQMSAMSSDGQIIGIGGTIRADSIRLSIDILSSEEFGEIDAVRVIVGKVGTTTEQTAFRFEGNQSFSLQKDFLLDRISATYVRVEVTTSDSGNCDGEQHFCFTNPIWIDANV
ncbi:MAG: CehA/McbA family metallohydrolase [Ignavibacteriales bacterium]|nr:CehA/McbA family metallohydrolase [Ignavibacteriales bacterium]